MYFISAPFGNYIKTETTVSVTGSWTLIGRSGLIKQVVKTLRPTKTGWRNSIGLRNKGLLYAIENHREGDVMSLAAVNNWNAMYDRVSPTLSVEVNISCPNTGSPVDELLRGYELWPQTERDWCIAKVSPIVDEKVLDKLVEAGYNTIHASNTLPSDKGGLSGKVLIPHTMRILSYIKETHPHVQVIAGGGVTCKQDAQDYINAGANHISLGTVCFTPWKLKGIVE